jgi:hypothetical protein
MLLEPGEYHLTGFVIKVARSARDVNIFTAARERIVKDGKSRAGTFRVAAGETVYVGNFAIDCADQPMPWRYYTEGREAFDDHLAQYKSKYPFVDTSKVVYRLFDTKTTGYPYELK